MTVTIDLDPALLARVEAQAAREGTTPAQLVGRIVETQLGGAAAHAAASAPAIPAQRACPPLPVFDGGGFPPSVAPYRNASAAVDAEEDEKYLRFARGELPAT
ncbi:hypothetical protein tb265_09860 [Gemmatimonadetes bacterium T265]|nr:hypothetical protein tb265_09860 [Gemmatimonadetes bacterium T265]